MGIRVIKVFFRKALSNCADKVFLAIVDCD
jgi:hypothetical protein